jgi:hypothetical protein
MKRRTCVPLLLVALAAVPAARAGNYMSNAWSPRPDGSYGGVYYGREAEGMVGPYGAPVMARAPASYGEPTGADYARQVLAQSMPQQMLMQAGFQQPVCGPNGCGPMGCGPMMGPGMAGPGGLPPGMGPGGPAMNSAAYNGPPGAVAAVGAIGGPGGPGNGGGPGGPPYGAARTEVRFTGPAGMKISWYAPTLEGKVGFTKQYLEAPARYNFMQASIYRLKLSDIPGRPSVELYPTLEVVPANAKTATFLAHSAVPIRFTDEDLEQVAAGNFIVKVIYLPDPQYQDLAATGPDEVVSSRLEPGVDPLLEAKRRGSILAVVRLGDIDLEAPNTPAMDAPPPGGAGNGPGCPPGLAGGPPMPQMGPMPPQMGQMPPMMMMPPPPMPPVPAGPKPTTPVNTNDKPATPLGQLPMNAPVQPAMVTAPLPETTKPPARTKTTLMDLLGKPTSSR